VLTKRLISSRKRQCRKLNRAYLELSTLSLIVAALEGSEGDRGQIAGVGGVDLHADTLDRGLPLEIIIEVGIWTAIGTETGIQIGAETDV
jgi:hypothetical protein